MERRLKERLIGGSVLLMLAVIFIPMILDNSTQTESAITESNIPPRPEAGGIPAPAPIREPAAPRSEDETAAAVPSAPPRDPEENQAGQPESAPAPRSRPAADPATAETVGVTAWVVQLGSFSSEQNATALNKKLRAAGFPSFVEPLKQGDETSYRVRIGPELLRSDAAGVLERLKKEQGLDGIVLRYP